MADFHIRMEELSARKNARAFEKAILESAWKTQKAWEEIVVFCVGTDRSTGDSYGPLVGHLLLSGKRLFRVVGTLEKPVTAMNLRDELEKISENALVIAVDSSVGKQTAVGMITVKSGPLFPGSGLGKDLPEAGDVSVSGIVAESSFASFLALQNAPLGVVFSMAEATAKVVLRAANKLALSREAERMAAASKTH